MASSRGKRTRRGSHSNPPPVPSNDQFDFQEEIDVPELQLEAGQSAKYWSLEPREKGAQKFVDLDTLETLAIAPQIRALFRNIRMEGILSLDEPSYLRPTLEFLSSLKVNQEQTSISFRMFNTRYEIHADQICQIINAPSSEQLTYSPKGKANSAFHQSAGSFWQSITGRSTFQSKSAKAACILHPVLKVAHRIFCSILFPQEEMSKCGLQELEPLWCMVHAPERTPHFGLWVIQKLSKTAKSAKGQIHCGGLITAICKHPAIGIRFPDDLDLMEGGRYLNIHALEAMRLFRIRAHCVFWQVNNVDYYRVTSSTATMHGTDTCLVIRDPVSDTDWLFESNMGKKYPGQKDSDDEDDEDDEDIDAYQFTSRHNEPQFEQHPSSQYGQSSSNPYMTMAHYHQVRADIESVDNTLQELSLEVHEFRQDFNAYRTDQNTHNAHLSGLLTDIRGYMQTQNQQQPSSSSAYNRDQNPHYQQIIQAFPPNPNAPFPPHHPYNP